MSEVFLSPIPHGCTLCDLCKTRKNIVPSFLPVETEILFVGEAPGEVEDREGVQPFTGSAGNILTELLYHLGLDISNPKFGFTYIVKCRPVETSLEKLKQGRVNRPLKDIEIIACSNFLDEEIRCLSKLKLIVCLGVAAAKRIVGSIGTSFGLLQGKIVNSPYGNVLIGMHPSKLNHASSAAEKSKLFEEAKLSLAPIVDILSSGEKVQTRKSVDYKIVRNLKQAEWLFNKLNASELFTFDLETSSLDYLTSDILCVSFSFKEHTGLVLPFFKQGLVHMWGEEDYNYIYQNLKSIMENPAIKKVGHNGKFDMLHLKAFGINVKGYYADTMLMHFCLNENEKHGLKELAWVYTDMGGYDDELEVLRKATAKSFGLPLTQLSYSFLPEEELWQYAAADADVTLRLYNKFLPSIYEENLFELLQTYYTAMAVFLTDVEFHGIQIDYGYLLEKIQEYKVKIDILETRILNNEHILAYVEEKKNEYRKVRSQKWYNSSTIRNRVSLENYVEVGVDKIVFNGRSNKQLVEFFIGKMKMPILEKTNSGNPSVNAEVLDKYAKRLPVANLLSKQNKLRHLLSTFLEGMRDQVRVDKSIHTSFNLHVTVTGRLSSTGPNLQNVPNKTNNPDDAELIRNIFIADKDCVILEADYGQAEFRCIKEGSKVLMSDFTLKNIEEVLVGEKVLSIEENRNTARNRRFRIATVTHTHFQGIKDCVKVQSEGGEIVVTSDHLFLQQNKKYFEWKEVFNGSNCINFFSKSVINDMDDYLKGTIVGLYLTDGTLRNISDNHRYISISQSDEEVINFVFDFLRNHNFTCTRSKGLVVLGKTEEVDTFLSWLNIKSFDFLKGVVSGCIHGDGWFISSDKKGASKSITIGISVQHLEVVDYLQDVFKKLETEIDFEYNLHKFSNSLNNQDFLYFSIRSKWFGFFPILIPGQKKGKFETFLQRVLVNVCGKNEVKVIENQGKHKVYDLTTTSGTFICENFIVHNCWAQMSGDEVMYEDLRNGLDIHRKFASIGFGIPEDQVDKDLRNNAKSIVFGTMYGRSPESVATALNISVKQAQTIQQSLFKRYKKAAMWLKTSKAKARIDGFVTGCFGQKRRLKDQLQHFASNVREEAERQAVNAPIQGSASQMTCFAAMRIFDEFSKRLKYSNSRVCLLIHDAILMNVHKSDVEEALRIIDECMLSPHPSIDVPLKIDIKCGKKWGVAKEMTKSEILDYVAQM